jgi:hypothetical protein
MPALLGENFDARFEFGLDVLVRGLEARLRADAGRGLRPAKRRMPRAVSRRRYTHFHRPTSPTSVDRLTALV